MVERGFSGSHEFLVDSFILFCFSKAALLFHIFVSLESKRIRQEIMMGKGIRKSKIGLNLLNWQVKEYSIQVKKAENLIDKN